MFATRSGPDEERRKTAGPPELHAAGGIYEAVDNPPSTFCGQEGGPVEDQLANRPSEIRN